MFWMKFAHSDEAEIRKIRRAVCVTHCQFGKPGDMIGHNECRTDQPGFDESQNQAGTAQVKRGLRQYRFAG
jgi:hypothetical protein